MPFVNEVVSDDDIDRYGLPFTKGGGRFWTRDKDRDLYLWGGVGGNPAWGEEIEGRFHLYICGNLFRPTLSVGKWSNSPKEKPFIVSWDKILGTYPPDLHGLSTPEFIKTLKEALICYGYDGRDRAEYSNASVIFGF